MNEIIVHPRKKPVILSALFLAVCIGFGIWLLSFHPGRGESLIGTLIAVMAALLISILTGYFRVVTILDDKGITTVTSAYAKKESYKWKEIEEAHISKYTLYFTSTQKKWLGAFDLRCKEADEAMNFLKKKKIRIIEEHE